MRIVGLRIEAFRSIRDLEIHFDPHLILIGKNNSGKTNVIKAIKILVSLPEKLEPEDFPSRYFRKDNKLMNTRLIGTFNLPLSSSFNQYLRRKLRTSSTTFTVELEASRQTGVFTYDFQFGAKRAGQSRADILRELRNRMKSELDFVWIPSLRGSERPSEGIESEYIKVLLSVIFDFQGRGRRRSIEKSFYQVIDHCRDILSDAERSLKTIGQQYLGLVDLQIRPRFINMESLVGDIGFTVSDGISTVDLAEKGTGWQSSFVIMLLQYIGGLRKSIDAIFAIEEPEAFLHPGDERQSIEAIRKLMRKYQVVMTTHSNVLVDELNTGEWCYLHKIEKKKEGTFIYPKSELNDDERSKYCLHTDSKLAEVLFADSVLYVEGLSDEYVMKHILKYQRRIKPNVSICSIGGHTMSNLYAGFSRSFNIKTGIILDNDSIIAGTEDPNVEYFAELLKRSPNRETRQFINEIRGEARVRCGNDTNALRRRYRSVNDRLNGYGIFVLPADVEYSIISDRNVEKAREVLIDIGIIDNASEEENVDELRRVIGSRGPDHDWPESPWKRKYIPREIVANSSFNEFEDNFRNLITRLGKFLTD